MEILGLIVHLLLISSVFAVPLILSVKKFGFVKVNIISIPVCTLLICVTVFWPELYRDIRLELMGFDFNGMSDEERAINVSPELQEEATKLYWSYMGIGWPLKAITAMVILLPYPSIAFMLVRLVRYF